MIPIAKVATPLIQQDINDNQSLFEGACLPPQITSAKFPKKIRAVITIPYFIQQCFGRLVDFDFSFVFSLCKFLLNV